MQSWTKSLVAAGVFVFGINITAYAATYQYTGNNYTGIANNLPDGESYTTSMSVSGSFTLASSLAANAAFSDISALVTSFSFFERAQYSKSKQWFIHCFI